MTKVSIVHFSEIQSLLESGFKKCLQRASELTKAAEESIRNSTGFNPLPDKEVLNHLQQLCPSLYRVIGDVLFQLIPLVQPEDCADEKQLNFYFWPGYHSYLANRRVFVKSDGWNFGIGIFRDPDSSQTEHYDDCSQARWYHYLVAERNQGEITPGDVHQWLRFQQQPHVFKDKSHFVGLQWLANSLTATTKAIDAEEQALFKGDKFLLLDSCQQNTLAWGEQYAEFINHYRVDQSWTFPDRWGKAVERESRLRALRCKMHSVWLHATFCDRQPPWLAGFIEKLLLDSQTQPSGVALQQGLKDKVAVDWGDASYRRPSFNCWTYLSLHASLAPSIAMHEPPYQAEQEERRNMARQSLGSAELLSSIPLRPRYFSLVRPWISEVYGLVRNAEISILLENHKLEARKTDLAGPYWAHELMKLTDEGLSTVYRDIADIQPKALSNMKFVLHSIRMLSSLAYLFTGPIFTGAHGETKQREEFLKPLRQLHEEGRLPEALKYVAKQTYENLCPGDGPHVTFGADNPSQQKTERLHFEEHRSCFLLASEMVRNYCESERDTCSAEWEALVTDGKLTVTLIGTTNAQRNPASMTLARLNGFLRTLEIGSANVDWNRKHHTCEYKIEVNLAKPNTTLTEGSAPVASGLPNIPPNSSR